MTLSTFQKLFFSHLMALSVGMSCIGVYLYMQTMAQVKQTLQIQLLETVRTVSQKIDAQQLRHIRSAKDKSSAIYREKMQILRAILQNNPSITDVYILRRGMGAAQYVLHSNTLTTLNLGTNYEPYTTEVMDGFYQVSVDKEISSYQWGRFLSAYAPIKHGRGTYLMGVDMHADGVNQKYIEIKTTALWACLVSLLSALLFSFLSAKHFTRRMNVLLCKYKKIKTEPTPELQTTGDELAQLATIYEANTNHLQQNKLESQRALQQMQDKLDHLEKHFKVHTHDLEQSNEQLRFEIDQRVKIEKELAKVACTDELTGLMNRRAMMRMFKKLIKNYGQQPEDFCVVLINIAHFNDVNLQYGVTIADQILVQFCTFLRNHLSEKDAMGRWSGSDFILLMKQTNEADAQDFAHELYDALTHYHFHTGQVQLQVHLGVCVYRSTMKAEQTINHAFTALMQAKQRGSYCAVYHE